MPNPETTTPKQCPCGACCGTCADWTPHPDERMEGYGSCAHREAWEFVSSISLCTFSVNRWRKKQ